jgi:serine/threonine protein kinase
MMAESSSQPQVPIAATPPDAAARSTDQELSATVVYPHGVDPSASDETAQTGMFAGGTLLKHFRIMRLIGRGGMGDVYEAHDESLERTVAIKVIRAGRNIAPADHTRLVHEARAQARLNHPHVVQIYYVGLEPDCPFLAMEFVHGTTLADKLNVHPLPFRDIVRISLETIEALRRAAEIDIVHADIKPSNILLDEAGSAKLSDFGLAQRKPTDGTHAAVLTGTPKYMAPELLDGARSSVASDMYALGIMLYEMTLGRYPYGPAATTVRQQLDLHRRAEISFPKPWPANIPEGWKDILARLLAKQPQNRYADYARLHADVSRFRPTTRLPAALLPRGLAWLIDLVLLAIILGFIGLSLFLLKNGPQGTSDPGSALGWIILLLQSVVFGLLLLAQARMRTTPGKRLFQISIADQHGLPSPPIRLMSRFALSEFPISLYLVFYALGELTSGKLWLMPIAGLIAGAALIGNVVSLLIDKRRLALHDRLLGTRAVVDHAG